MRNFLPGLLAIGGLLLGANVHAAEPKPAAKAEASTTEPRTQTLKGFTYFYISTRANFQNIAEKAKTLVPAVEKAVAEAHARQAGSLIFIYHGVTEDPAKDFDLEIGVPIAEKVTPAGEFKVRDIGEYPCMSVLYAGPLASIASAFEKLMPAALTDPSKLTGETREMYLYFEAPDSPNNVVHVSVGLK